MDSAPIRQNEWNDPLTNFEIAREQAPPKYPQVVNLQVLGCKAKLGVVAVEDRKHGLEEDVAVDGEADARVALETAVACCRQGPSVRCTPLSHKTEDNEGK